MNILIIFEKLKFFLNIYFVIDRDGFGSVTVVVCVNEKCLKDLWYHQRSHHDEIVRDVEKVSPDLFQHDNSS